MQYKNSLSKDFFQQGERKIIGIASHVGDPADLDGDIIAEGAFNKSIEELAQGKKIKLLDGHSASGATTIGQVTRLWMEDSKLMFEAKISESSSGEDIYIKLKEGILDQVSIGFRTFDQSFRKDGIRVIEELELVEISVVPIPANPGANILSVKSQELQPNPDKETAESKTLAAGTSESYKQHITDYLVSKINYLNNRSK